MDWSKAKSVLIIIFLILNIFLLINICLLIPDNEFSRDAAASVESILMGKGVTLKCNIPKKSGYGATISYEEGSSFDKSAIITKLIGNNGKIPLQIKLSEPLTSGNKSLVFKTENCFLYTDSDPNDNIDLSNTGKANKYVSAFIDKLKLSSNSGYEHYRTNKNSDGSITLIYMDKYEGYLLFGNYIEIVLTNKGIKSFEYRFKKVNEPLEKDDKRIMLAYQVLLKNISSIENSTVTSIDLGFNAGDPAQDMKGSWENIIWRIGIEGKGYKYFNAVTGAEVGIVESRG